jgi:hypothetical protein
MRLARRGPIGTTVSLLLVRNRASGSCDFWYRATFGPTAITLLAMGKNWRWGKKFHAGRVGRRPVGNSNGSAGVFATGCNGEWLVWVIRYRSLGGENRFMSAMPRKRRLAVKVSPVAMGHKRTSADGQRGYIHQFFIRVFRRSAMPRHTRSRLHSLSSWLGRATWSALVVAQLRELSAPPRRRRSVVPV